MMPLLAGLTGCCWLPGGSHSTDASPWEQTSTRRLAANELWKEHNGADQIYIEYGNVSETMTDYRHRIQPWAIHCSVFDQTNPKGAWDLFEFYREGVDDELAGVELIGDAIYVWKPSGMRCWTMGFRKGHYFVEVSLSDKSESKEPLTDASRKALREFARELAASL